MISIVKRATRNGDKDVETVMIPLNSSKQAIYYPQYCYDCMLPFISDKRHAECWNCNGENTINCYEERLVPSKP